MKQLSLFDAPTEDTQRVWRLAVDGASRGNPGIASVGIHLTCEGVDILRQGFFIGHATNNQAEYSALLLGLCQALNLMGECDRIELVSDSELLVRQILGRYSVKNHILKRLHEQVIILLQGVRYTIKHVLREDNKVADALANEGIDKKIPVPEELRIRCGLPEDRWL